MWDSTGHRHLLAGGRLTGRFGVDVTPESLVRLGNALASAMPRAAVISVARDAARPSASAAEILMGSLTASGSDVRDLRVLPMPVLRHDVELSADAGVMVRSIPGQPDLIEINVLDSRGRPLDEARSRAVERLYARQDFRRPLATDVGARIQATSVVEDYCDSIRGSGTLHGVADSPVTVVVDAGGGSAGSALPLLLGHAGIDLVLLGGRADEGRVHADSAQRKQAIRALADRVVATRATMGIYLDPAAERLGLVDELGNVLDEDRTLLVVLDLVAAERRGGRAVLPVTTSRVAEQVGEFHGTGVIRAAQPELSAEVADALLVADGLGGFAIGSGSRHLDGLAACAALIGLVGRTRLTLSAIDARIPRTALLRESVDVSWSARAAVMREIHLAAASMDHDVTLGVRSIESDGAWCLVLPDPHDSRIRLWAEAPSIGRAQEIIGKWRAMVVAAAGE
mgnify:CR=1 FL=1